MRAAGLSAAKTRSIRALAERRPAGSCPSTTSTSLGDEELIERLSAVPGIGRWTAEMFLIFQLGRLDVWPVGDLGVRKGYATAWGLPELPTPKELDAYGDAFRPYRSVAAWYCWRAVDTVVPDALVGCPARCASPSAASTRRCPSRPPPTPATPATTSGPGRPAVLAPGRRPGRRPHRHRRGHPARLRRPRPAPLRPGPPPRRDLPQRPRPDRRRLPGRDPGHPGQPRPRPSRSRSRSATASPSS